METKTVKAKELEMDDVFELGGIAYSIITTKKVEGMLLVLFSPVEGNPFNTSALVVRKNTPVTIRTK